MPHRAIVAAWSAASVCLALTVAAASPTPTNSSANSAPQSGCFAGGEGYLRARLRGALDLDLDWKNAEMECEGGPRPPGKDNKSNGVRVSIAGPARGDGRRIRLV